ncbi:hypothetical protein DEU56DRAFT_470599 [Suillus clintonianus]|uniref:uncharacterized protein n=1 Tax=Suillus clintonianus TaxID=1904413 RepID=UPI001B862D83|nr:uncharacterized protein DEU56DRAFT_470599 [Suillus clintonianus]KAG2153159.1 hypothetical protein DEU56DRAFT_470599 [Suillus clintonianus]
MELSLNSCLELLDRHCDRLNSTYKEVLEIRARITEMLAMGNTGASQWDNSVDPIFGDEPPIIAPVALNEFDAIPLLSTPPNLSLPSQPPEFHNLHVQPSDEGYGHISQASVGVISTLPKGPDPAVHQLPRDPFLPGTSGSISDGFGTQPLQKFSQDGDGQTLSGPSGRRHQRLSLPVAENGDSKVKCMLSGCSSVVKKDNYTRHVNEVHKRLFKAVCTDCGKEFLRPYMKKTHACPDRHAKRSSS